MSAFDSFIVVDWSAGRAAPSARADAIWIARNGAAPVFQPSRLAAEAYLAELVATSGRTLLCFDFPFGYPTGFAQAVTGQPDPFALWDWLEDRITDTAAGENNRFDVAEQINALFDGPGPFWGKHPAHKDRWPGVPFRKQGIAFQVPERRETDLVAKAASSCFQLSFPPTVGGQALMGIPMLCRLRRSGAAVWPFEDTQGARVVLAEIWPGLIEPAVKAQSDKIRDAAQVRLLSKALHALPAEELAQMLAAPSAAGRREEAWILGAGHAARLTGLAMPLPDPPPPLGDCFVMPRGVDWVPVDVALGMLRKALGPRTEVATVDTEAALGRVLAAPALAARSHPPRANTAVDGYGFAGGRGTGVHRLPLVPFEVPAGDPANAEVPKGHAVRILTGASLPPGVDTVALQEDVSAAAGQIAFHGPIKTGANVRKAGEDMTRGAPILPTGRRLRAADLGTLAAAGCARVDVRTPLRVGVLSTGDELVSLGTNAQEGQIFDANRPMLLSTVRGLGHSAVDLGHVPDTDAALRRKLNGARGKLDAILTSGGASSGAHDVVARVLRAKGALHTWRIAVKPGRPLALGTWDGIAIFGLPGNPVAAFVCTLVFAAPALALMAGEGWRTPTPYLLPAGFSKTKKAGRREYLRARPGPDGVEVFPSEGSGRISGLSWAEGLVELPDGAAHIAPGDPVRYLPWSAFGLTCS